MTVIREKSTARASDPMRIADVVLSAAIRARADAVFVEPDEDDERRYAITLERARTELTCVHVDAALGAAVIARLAYLAELDVASASVSSGSLPVRSGTREATAFITVRPGTALRADIMLSPRADAALPTGRIGLAPGDVVGAYEVIEHVGEGGMGTVYRCRHTERGRDYALKVLRAQVVERDPTAARRFLGEARTAARVHHPNIIEVIDDGTLADGRPYLVMELLAGESLALRVSRGALPPAEAVAIARQLATALAAAHDRGVVHADVTPANAIVTGTGTAVHVKLVDFGLAEIVGDMMPDASTVTTELALGTPAYISPEQLRGLSPTDRSDQYSLGAVLFELLVGRPPYEHPNLRTLCMMHLTAAIPPVESPHGPLPPKLADAVTTCLQKTPQARFPGMRALLVALDEIERITERRGWRRWLSS